MTANTNISPTLLNNIKNLFVTLNWNIGDGEYGDIVFDSFCEVLSCLDNKQQDCILELTKKFLRIDYANYHYHIRRSLANINKQSLHGVERVFVLPLWAKKDFGKPKSSPFVAYTLIGREIRAKDILGTTTVQVLEKKEWLNPILNANNWKLLLVDDFIGTGETAEEALNELLQDTGVDKSKVILLTLVAQRVGYERLLTQGIEVVYSVLRNKGISDEYIDPLRQEYLDIMNSIGKTLKIKSKLRLGYKDSEALVTLNRTPNNTFPVYWEKLKVNNKLISAPFSRYD